MNTFSFKKGERILRKRDFARLSQYGRKIQGDYFVVTYCRNNLQNSRLGVTVSKRVGCAVVRNRIKRLVREHFRLNKGFFDHTYDMNVIAKTGAGNLSSQETHQTLEAAFCKISKD